MPNQIPFNYYQNNLTPEFLKQNDIYQDINQNKEQNIMHKIYELEQKIENLENKINEIIKHNQHNNALDFNYKTSMHMM